MEHSEDGLAVSSTNLMLPNSEYRKRLLYCQGHLSGSVQKTIAILGDSEAVF